MKNRINCESMALSFSDFYLNLNKNIKSDFGISDCNIAGLALPLRVFLLLRIKITEFQKLVFGIY